MKLRILFVDDEPHVLQGLRRLFRDMQEEWDMAFVESGFEALNILEKKSFDVVVSDMKMPGMNGVKFLDEIKERYPKTTRIIFSGCPDYDLHLKLARSTHQFLAKPSDSAVLKSILRRVSEQRVLA
ncbi:MAG: response regulator [Planctomycetes bacterium]|nr:response regulator [Planctomycetota bacterium]